MFLQLKKQLSFSVDCGIATFCGKNVVTASSAQVCVASSFALLGSCAALQQAWAQILKLFFFM